MRNIGKTDEKEGTSGRIPIDIGRLRDQMFRHGFQDRRSLAKAAGISEKTLNVVFATGEATVKTKLKLSLVLYGQPVVADPEMLEASA